MAGLHSTPRYVEHERCASFTMYDGGTAAVERYLETSLYDVATRLLADCTEVDPMVIHSPLDVVDYISGTRKERRIIATSIKLRKSDAGVSEEDCLAAAALLVDAFAVCGRAFSQEAAGKEVELSAIQQEVFATPS